MWLNIAMHDSTGMAIIECAKELVNVVAHIVVGQRRVECLEIDVIDILLNEARGLSEGLNDDIQQVNDVGTAREILQDLDLTKDLLLLDGFENLDDTRFFFASHDTALKDFTVLATADFAHDLIIVLVAPFDLK